MLIMQIPFCVVMGWMMGKEMDLNFQLFETATLFITVLVVAFMLQVCSQTELIIDRDLDILLFFCHLCCAVYVCNSILYHFISYFLHLRLCYCTVPE